MHDPVFFDQGWIDADFPATIRISPRTPDGEAVTRTQLTGSHRALEEFLDPRFTIRVIAAKASFGLAR
jgi:hypothetical protein